jgi:hypothetical protein
MQCKSDPTLHYWKSPADLPAYLSSQVKALNPTTLTMMKPCTDVLLRTEHVGCILAVTQLVNPANALVPGIPVIMLVAAPSMANIGLQSKDDTRGILCEDLWDLSVLEPFESFLNPEEPDCPVLAASEGLYRSIASPTPQLYLEDANPICFPTRELLCGIIEDDQARSTYRSFPFSRNMLSSTWSSLADIHWLCQSLGERSSSRSSVQTICFPFGWHRTASSSLLVCRGLRSSRALFYPLLQLRGGNSSCISVYQQWYLSKTDI